MPRKVEISHKTIIFTVLFLIFLWFLYFIRDIIFVLFVALLFMAILDPLVTRLTKWKIPRSLAVLATYIIMIGLVAGTIALIAPPLVDQTTNFVNNLPTYLRNPIISKFINNQTLDQTVGQLSSVPGQVVKTGVSIFSNLVGIMSVFIFTFYLLLYRGKLDKQVGFFFGEDGKAKFGRVLDMIERSLGGWARGELILMLSIGVLTFIGLTILGIPYSLPLAVLAGILEIVPTIGPIIAAIPMVIVALTISPIMSLGTVALAFLIHQSENYFLVPKIMEKSVGVNPIVTLASLAIGFRLMGVVGALVSVPVLLTIQIIIKEYLQNK